MKYGLIGKTLVHSYSKEIHEALEKYTYELFSLSEEEMPAFVNARDFGGLNVTIPYKKDVIPLCDEISPLAEAIGAVNTLYWKPDDAASAPGTADDADGAATGAARSEARALSESTGTADPADAADPANVAGPAKGRRLVGHNTDYEGFLYAAKRAKISFADKTVLILGSGGTSLMARKAAADNGAVQIYIASRKPSPQDQTAQYCAAQEKCAGADVHMPGAPGTESPETASQVRITQLTYSDLPQIAASVEVIVNTTPVGTYPNNMKSVIELADFPKCEAVIDVIYNPFKTKLLLEAEKAGLRFSNGLPMLVAQATAAAGYFLGTPGAFQTENERIIKTLRNRMQNIAIIGMPGSGKSTIGRLIAELTGKRFIDMDAEIEARAKITIPEIFEKYGEKHFRDLESETAADLGKEHGLVIATGGGAVLRPENADALRQNATVIHTERPVSSLPTDGRPLSKDIDTLIRMEKDRLPIYKAAADITFDNSTICPESELREKIKTVIAERL